MKRLTTAAAFFLAITVLFGCSDKPAGQTTGDTGAAAPKPVDLNALVASVPNEGPREGNNYKVFFLVLRQNQQPAANFKVDMWIKGKSEPKTVRTNEAGLARFDDLPFPDAKHRLNAVLHYYKGQEDQPREIDYPYLDTDAYRLKDTQYIPNTVTPDPESPVASRQ